MTEFSDPKIQEIYDDQLKFLEMHKDKLNNISRDIKQLEKFLGLNAIKNFDFPFQDQDIEYVLSYKEKRLFLNDGKQDKPLIETKIHLRLMSAKYLSDFLEKCIQNTLS